VNVVRAAAKHLRDGGSVTVTTGVLAMRPMPGAAAISLVNAGLEGFVRAAGLEMPRGLRVNAVSPGWIKETLVKLGMDPAPGLSAEDCARFYVRVVEGSDQGAIIDASKP
jgi:NAD(P)-dependent dehydrogenase (short-subunit alcohol dehydrogenase family)